jgi:hypothetical protein
MHTKFVAGKLKARDNFGRRRGRLVNNIATILKTISACVVDPYYSNMAHWQVANTVQYGEFPYQQNEH